MKSIFLDTSGLVALLSKKDAHHKDALRFWNSLLDEAVALYLTDYVFDETYTMLRHWAGHEAACSFGDLILESETTHLIVIDEGLFDASWEIARTYDDKSYSFTDCASFAAMDHLGLDTAFSFDRHFVQHGFTVKP